MAKKFTDFSLQKVSDVDAQYCDYEIICNGSPVLSVSADSGGIGKVYLSMRTALDKIEGVEIDYDQFVELLQRARERLQEEIDSNMSR